jgi:hypothetical protein
VLNFQDKCPLLAEFSYNNSYQESLRMAPFDALYGCRCHTPLNWVEPNETTIFVPDLVTEAEKIVCHIQSNIKATRAQQETYANKRCRPLEFEPGNRMYLHVLPTRGVKRFGIKNKLAPCYIGPFPVLAKLLNVAYRLELPPSLPSVHNMFDFSQLKKCLKPSTDVIIDDVTPLAAFGLGRPSHEATDNSLLQDLVEPSF